VLISTGAGIGSSSYSDSSSSELDSSSEELVSVEVGDMAALPSRSVVGRPAKCLGPWLVPVYLLAEVFGSLGGRFFLETREVFEVANRKSGHYSFRGKLSRQ